MSKETILLAKAAALKKSFQSITFYGNRCLGQSIEHLFPIFTSLVDSIKEINPDLFSDIPNLEIPKSIGPTKDGPLYEKQDIEPLINNLDFILELQSNSRIGENILKAEKKRKIFISHGRSVEWYKVQAYIEKDLNIPTLELTQEPNLGRTVLQKLNEEADKCSVAVIVMTGDDMTADGEIRARENVMHEIGFFQGKYGLSNVFLLHEAGVNIPSNIHGLVYIGFPKDTIDATFGALLRELKVILP